MHHNTIDPHDGRPVRPEYRERGERLMAQWGPVAGLASASERAAFAAELAR